jgi:hypothetical protein
MKMDISKVNWVRKYEIDIGGRQLVGNMKWIL